MNIQLIILAAGKGTRIGNSELPKVLLPLHGKSMIVHLMEEVNRLSFEHKLIIVVGHKHDLVQSTLGPEYVYALQQDQQGTAHAVEATKDYVTGENVLVIYGDMPFIKARSLDKIAQEHLSKAAVLTMFTATAPNFENEFQALKTFGRVIRDENNQIVKSVEFADATEQERAIREVNPCIYMFNTKWLWQNIGKIPKNEHGEYYLTDIIALAKRQNVVIHSLAIDPYEILGVNTLEQLETAERIFDKLRT